MANPRLAGSVIVYGIDVTITKETIMKIIIRIIINAIALAGSAGC
jgi:hypothetical protein